MTPSPSEPPAGPEPQRPSVPRAGSAAGPDARASLAAARQRVAALAAGLGPQGTQASGALKPAGPAEAQHAAAPASPAARASTMPLGRALGLLAAGAAALAALLGWTLAVLFEVLGVWPAGAAAVGAALGALALGLPGALLLRRVAHEAERFTPPLPGGEEHPSAVSEPLLMEIAVREWARARRYGTGAAVLLVEVDRWQRLCETRGPGAAEAVLRTLALQTAPTLRGADVVARRSGAQLAVFLVQADPTGALDVAERIRERAEMLEVAAEPQPMRFTVSVGVAHLRPAHPHLAALFEDAAEAVHAAREAGGNCVRAAPVARRHRPLGQPSDDRSAERPEGS
jgi:diguanylate cyclase